MGNSIQPEMTLSYLSGTLLRHDTWTLVHYLSELFGVFELEDKKEIGTAIDCSDLDTTLNDIQDNGLDTIQYDNNSPDIALDKGGEQEHLRPATSEHEDGDSDTTHQKEPDTSVFGKLPDEIWISIMSHLDTLEQIMLSQVCRRTRTLLPFERLAELSPDFMSHGAHSDKTLLLKIHAKHDRWNKLVALDDAEALGADAACSACKKVHDRSAFMPNMLTRPAAERLCRGMQVVFRMCEHEVLDFKWAKLYTRMGEIRTPCDVVPHGGRRQPGSFSHQYSQGPYSATRWESAVAKKLEPGYLHDRDGVPGRDKMPGVAKNRTCIAAGFHSQLQRHYLEAILGKDERPVCAHLRYCDIMATWSTDEEYLDCATPKICHQPFCLTAYGFVTKDREYVVFVVEKYYGMARDPADRYWLEMATEMKEDPKIEKKPEVIVKTEENKAADTEDSDDDETDDESDGYSSDDMGCMCGGICIECACVSRGYPLPKRRRGRWIFPGDAGYAAA